MTIAWSVGDQKMGIVIHVMKENIYIADTVYNVLKIVLLVLLQITVVVVQARIYLWS